MKQFKVIYTITGKASAMVEAETEDEAYKKAKELEVIDGSDEFIEWDFDEVENLEECE